MGVPRLPHLLGIEGLAPETISGLLDLSESYIDQNRSLDKRRDVLSGRTVINLFFENSTRTRTSFEVAAKRLGADVINMDVATSSVRKGETLLDTAMTLNAMRPDAIVVRHSESGAVNLLAQKVNCAVINGGDGQHEHPTQALLDALTIRRRRGSLQGLLVAICGDIMHSRVARSNIHLLQIMGARVRVVGPPTLMPTDIDKMGVEVHYNMRTATPISTCSRMSDWAPSATAVSISTPRFIGPGCMTSAPGFAQASFSWSRPK